MGRDLKLVLLVAGVTALAVRMWWPRTIHNREVVPTIVTRHDTVKIVPQWFKDSVKVWSKRRHTTDTLILTTTVTLIDTVTVRVPVNLPPEERPNLWPITLVRAGTRFGDTVVSQTFSLQSGQLGIARTFQPGMLTAVEWDSVAAPKFTFAPFPKPKGPGLWHNLKVGALGYGACSVVNLLKP